jgi:hypothetical protein
LRAFFLVREEGLSHSAVGASRLGLEGSSRLCSALGGERKPAFAKLALRFYDGEERFRGV